MGDNSPRRRKGISATERAKVAREYGLIPGVTARARCHWCPAVGTIHWHPFRGRERVGWVSLVDLEWDHLIPHSKGGSDLADNLVLACRRCNRSRCNRDRPAWIVRAEAS